MRWLYGWLVLAAAFVVTAALFPGIHVDWHPGVSFMVAAVFAFVNLRALLGFVVDHARK